jgi:lysozyme
MSEYIVDVSKHNGTIDWKKAKNAGVFAAIIRCGYGTDKEKNDDPMYLYNVNEAVNAGIKIGVYLYSYAKDNAAAHSEAEHALRLIIPFRDVIQLPVYYDVEEAGTEKGVSDRCRIFCDRIGAAGFTPGIYANIDWWRDYLKGVDEYTKWIAKWSEPKPVDPKMELWQFDAYGIVPGIGSGVDLNHAYGKVKEIIDGAGPEPEPTPAPEEIELKVTTLRRGDKGPEVYATQAILKAKGYYTKAMDSKAGPGWETAVKAYQADNPKTCGKSDGIVGPKTWDSLINT